MYYFQLVVLAHIIFSLCRKRILLSIFVMKDNSFGIKNISDDKHSLNVLSLMPSVSL